MTTDASVRIGEYEACTESSFFQIFLEAARLSKVPIRLKRDFSVPLVSNNIAQRSYAGLDQFARVVIKRWTQKPFLKLTLELYHSIGLKKELLENIEDILSDTDSFGLPPMLYKLNDERIEYKHVALYERENLVITYDTRPPGETLVASLNFQNDSSANELTFIEIGPAYFNGMFAGLLHEPITNKKFVIENPSEYMNRIVQTTILRDRIGAYFVSQESFE